jgi:ribonuclease BN (tRNA processing enzyme)
MAPRFDLTAIQAAEAAAAAGARRLLLTHFWPGNDRQRSRADACRHFKGEVLIADEGLEVLFGSRGARRIR